MKRTMKRTGLGILCALLLLPVAARAQQQGSIELKSTAQAEVVETNKKGEKQVKHVDVSKAKVVPGDVVVFTTTYKNVGKQPADKVTIMNPVPEHMLYMDQSADGKGMKIDFSVDKGMSYGSPDTLTVIDALGNKQRATILDYTNIRWIAVKPLAPGGKGTVSFKAKLK
jgi:uncharacterized repeat protein (TIGR01451 family)